MAAGRAAECGATVLLLEKTARLGNKLRISGKGRCNLTNTAELEDFIERFNGPFLYGAFTRFSNRDLIAFFEGRGLSTIVERGGRVFPREGDAHRVVDVLESYLRQSGARVRYGARVTELIVEEGRVKGVRLGEESLPAQVVVLASGGASYPATGSSGDGYRLAATVGHTIVPIRPALVPLVVRESYVRDLQGLSLRNVQVSLWLEGRPLARQFGEMLFTHFGVSGPVILTLSGRAAEALGGGRLELTIDLKPALSEEQLDRRLQRDFDRFGKRTYRAILGGLLPRKMIETFIRLTDIPAERRGHQVDAPSRRRLLTLLKSFRLTVTGTRPLAEAIVTAGGISTAEVDPRTMASRLVSGLFFCGEVLDVNADTGGYNLQAAFSTGYLAGEAAARQAG